MRPLMSFIKVLLETDAIGREKVIYSIFVLFLNNIFIIRIIHREIHYVTF